MRLEDLKMLATLYQIQNLTKTAELLFISQPALTVRLHNIEKELGCQIAIRTNKGLSFTPEGIYLANAATKITEQLETVLQEIKAMNQQSAGNIKLLAPASFFKYYLLDMIKDFEKVAPNIKLQLELTDSVNAAPKVEAMDAACAFVYGDYCGGLPYTRIASMSAYAISSEDINLNDLPEKPFITHDTSPKTIEMIRDWWHKQFHSELNSFANVKNIDICLHMVKMGFGTSIVFGDFFRQLYDLKTISLYNKDGTRLSRDVNFIYSPKLMNSSSINVFIQFVHEYFANGICFPG